MFQDGIKLKNGQGIFASGSGSFRSCWRKNCSVLRSPGIEKAIKVFARQFVARKRARACAASRNIFGVKTRCLEDERREYNKKNYFGFEKFSLEEKKILPIMILEE